MKKTTVRVNITEKERAILNYAIEHNEGEITEFANDDVTYMDTLCDMYRKHLINLDFKNDRLYVSDIGRGLLCL